MKQVTIIIIGLMIVCCGEVDAENQAGSYDNYIVPIVEINLDDLTFQEAFRIEHSAKGEGRTFWWRGNQYTTNLVDTVDEFVVYHADTEYETMGWVLNNDDPDDDCYYNKRDECGVCNGDGKITWFRDKDGDGLGTHEEWITSCYNPNIEDLREGAGDLGILD